MDTLMHDDDTPDLDPRLAQLRASMADLDTPRCVETELMQAFGAHFAPRRPWYRRLNLLEWSAAAIGSAVGIAVLGLLAMAPPLAGQRQETEALLHLDNGAAFIALDSFERIEADPAPRLVETEVPRTVLATLGLPVTPENAGEALRAEMLVGAGGEALALRLSSLH